MNNVKVHGHLTEKGASINQLSYTKHNVKITHPEVLSLH